MVSKFRCSAGRVAIWTGSDYAPFTDPMNNLDRVKFHSLLDYVRVVKTITRTVSLPSISAAGSGQSDPGSRVASYTLGAHGMGYTPFIVGLITVNGVRQAFTGSVLVHTVAAPNATSVNDMFGRWLALGADATNVYVHEYAVQQGNKQTGDWTPRPAQSFSIELNITDEAL